MKYNFLLRIRIISVLIFVFSSFLITKLFFVQVIHHDEYSDAADRQYVTPSENIFERGSIFFKKKDGVAVNAATTITGFKVAINPKEINDSEAIFSKLANIINIDHNGFLKKSAKKTDPYEEVAFRLTKEDADKIKKLGIPGVYIYKEKWRFYPGNSLGSQSIGFVGYKDNDFSGRYGIERFYNNVLSRQNNKIYVNFFAEVFASISDSLFENPKKEGDIITTLEPSVQAYTEGELETAVKKWNAKSGGIIVINPKDGSIYAMASYPDFNPNELSSAGSVSDFANPIVENVYEFGSVIKPFTITAGLDAKVITSNTKYEDKGFVYVDDKEIWNFDKKGRGMIDMQEILNQSLNTGAIFVMQKLGKEKFRQYMYDFGFNEKTNIDLPNEARSLVSNLKSSRNLEFATASFGQGIAFSVIQLIRGFSSLANGGYLISPHIVSEINYRDGSKEKKEYPIGKQIIKKESSDEITRMLTSVVDKSFKAGKYNLDKYSIAAKTGTAQIAKEDGSGYYEDKHFHSIIGYLPAYDPMFLVMYYLIDPKGKFAIETLRDPFMNTTKFLLNYYEIAPDR